MFAQTHKKELDNNQMFSTMNISNILEAQVVHKMNIT